MFLKRPQDKYIDDLQGIFGNLIQCVPLMNSTYLWAKFILRKKNPR
jgi:hypothetical protein